MLRKVPFTRTMLLYYCTYPIVLQAACSRAPAAQMSAAKAAIALAAAVAGATTPQNLFSRAARAQISEKKLRKSGPGLCVWDLGGDLTEG